MDLSWQPRMYARNTFFGSVHKNIASERNKQKNKSAKKNQQGNQQGKTARKSARKNCKDNKQKDERRKTIHNLCIT